MDARSDQSLKVALVRAPPPNWPLPLGNKNWTGITINISESVDAGIALINKAKSRGAALIAFPELWFPGYVADQPRSLVHLMLTAGQVSQMARDEQLEGDASSIVHRQLSCHQQSGVEQADCGN